MQARAELPTSKMPSNSAAGCASVITHADSKITITAEAHDINSMCGFVGWGGLKLLLVLAGRRGRKLVILTVFCKWMFSKSASTHVLWMRSTLPGHLFDTPVST